jgi:hypothetical protein
VPCVAWRLIRSAHLCPQALSVLENVISYQLFFRHGRVLLRLVSFVGLPFLFLLTLAVFAEG